MQLQKCSLSLYRDFLIANRNRYSGSELARVAPDTSMCHDAVSRWLKQTSFEPTMLWRHVQHLVCRTTGYLIADDSVLDKRYSRHNQLAQVQYSGNEHGLVNGIGLINLLWSDGFSYIPVDYCLYDKEHDNLTKNDHFRAMLRRAKKRRFRPRFVLFDAWYSSIENCKYIRAYGWYFITSLQSDRQVVVQKGNRMSVADLDLGPTQVRSVWLPGFGRILVCALIDQKGDRTYLATNKLSLTNYDRFVAHWRRRWAVEEFHRGLKQTTGIEGCPAISAPSQRTHIFASIIAYIKLETGRLLRGTSWYEQKAEIHRAATSGYLRANA